MPSKPASATADISLPQAPHCGPSIAAPNQGHGVISVSCSTTMAATPLKCIEAVLSSSEYPQWNTFCPKVIIEDAPRASALDFDNGGAPELKELIEKPTVQLYPGVKFQFEVILDKSRAPTTTSLEVSSLKKVNRNGKPGYRVAWKLRGMPSFLLRAERTQEFIQADDGGSCTEYYCWETFGGVLAYYIRYNLGSKLEDGFGRWMDSLKEWVQEGKPKSSD